MKIELNLNRSPTQLLQFNIRQRPMWNFIIWWDWSKNSSSMGHSKTLLSWSKKSEKAPTQVSIDVSRNPATKITLSRSPNKSMSSWWRDQKFNTKLYKIWNIQTLWNPKPFTLTGPKWPHIWYVNYVHTPN